MERRGQQTLCVVLATSQSPLYLSSDSLLDWIWKYKYMCVRSERKRMDDAEILFSPLLSFILFPSLALSFVL